MKMKSARLGKSTSAAEVTNISANGLWLLIDDRELFIPFSKFPWFKDATVSQISNVLRPGAHHLHWPDLDIDLAVESIEHPEAYPLMSRLETGARTRPTSSRKRRPESRQSRRRR
jgi:hypothetical protein